MTACDLYADYAASGFEVKPPGFDAAFSTTSDPDPVPVTDPPVNIQPDDPLVEGIPWTMLYSSHAFDLYVRLVASQLAMETSGCVPWTLEDYASADLAQLFDGRFTFRYVPAGASEWGTMTQTGHLVSSAVIPAPPLLMLGFLGQNGLIGVDREDSLIRLLEWERNHLQHVVGGAPANPLPSGVLFWGYNGRAPVSHMINGTTMAEPVYFTGGGSYFDPEPRHWVGGCGGASGFNHQVLRVTNIAAERTAYAHFQNRFALDGGVHVGTCHADDPYGISAAPEIPMAETLLDDATFQAWFIDESDATERSKHVGRCTADLHVQYLPLVLLERHCGGLWTEIEAKLTATGGCGAL